MLLDMRPVFRKTASYPEGKMKDGIFVSLYSFIHIITYIIYLHDIHFHLWLEKICQS